MPAIRRARGARSLRARKDGASLKVIEDVVLIVDADHPRVGRNRTEAVEVAVGIVWDAEGKFLVSSRPPGKVYAGYWEFPGGKLEAGESPSEALRRELLEELGIRVLTSQPWRTQCVDYPHGLVRLNFMNVWSWSGQLQMRESQTHSWQTLPVNVGPILPGALPVLRWLAEERPIQKPLDDARNRRLGEGEDQRAEGPGTVSGRGA
jgi:8-oxo-dGTP diphosphatase